MPSLYAYWNSWRVVLLAFAMAAASLLTSPQPVRANELTMVTLETNFGKLDSILLELNNLITARLPITVQNNVYPAARFKQALNRKNHCTAIFQRTEALEDEYLWIAYQMELPISFYRASNAPKLNDGDESITAVLKDSYAEVATSFLGIETWRGNTYDQIQRTLSAGRVDDWLVIDYVPQLMAKSNPHLGLTRIGQVITVEAWTACGPKTDTRIARHLQTEIARMKAARIFDAFYKLRHVDVVTRESPLVRSLY